MWSYILTGAISSAASVGLLLYHQYSIRRATEKMTEEYRMRKEINRLRAENEELRYTVTAADHCQEMRHVREQGYKDGKQRAMNMKRLEVLDNTLKGESGKRNVQVGGAAK